MEGGETEGFARLHNASDGLAPLRGLLQGAENERYGSWPSIVCSTILCTCTNSSSCQSYCCGVYKDVSCIASCCASSASPMEFAWRKPRNPISLSITMNPRRRSVKISRFDSTCASTDSPPNTPCVQDKAEPPATRSALPLASNVHGIVCVSATVTLHMSHSWWGKKPLQCVSENGEVTDRVHGFLLRCRFEPAGVGQLLSGHSECYVKLFNINKSRGSIALRA
ncbi:hypothetical protein IQ06DRAFT_20589 [Phaeosphaeriaceae sp. SRC1lsM3a]|nr:hypothetical protein IQ06DRAFT_20589 [Stagonospora sp. SRC1lsM3a]